MIREAMGALLCKALAVRGRESFALGRLDWKLLPYLPYRRGFFIEAGANDGVAQSNMLYLERYRGWTGLLVEPIPELAERCRRNRPKSFVENCALVPFGYPDTVEMRYCNLMSMVKGAMAREEQELDHIRRGREVQRLPSTYELTVRARPLTELLDRYRPERIDLFSLDVEGFELNVLRGLDLDRYRPRYLLIEVRDRSAMDAFLAPYYEPVAVLSDLGAHRDILYRCRRR